MSNVYTTINSPDFQAKVKTLLARYADMKMVYSFEGQTPYYCHRERLAVMDEVFDGNMFIDVTPAPNQESALVIAKATLYIVTSEGPEEVMSRFGRANKGVISERLGKLVDVTEHASRIATYRLLEAIGMPSNDIEKDFNLGEYQVLEDLLDSLKITLATALDKYNNDLMFKDSKNDKAGRPLAKIKKSAVRDMNVFEVNCLLSSLSKMAVKIETA